MQTYYVTSNRNQHVRDLLAFEGETQTIQYDFAAWETDNGAVTAVTWTVKSGDAAIANDALASSIASAEVTTSNTGKSMIRITATAGNNTFITHLHVHSKDPDVTTNDYGILSYG